MWKCVRDFFSQFKISKCKHKEEDVRPCEKSCESVLGISQVKVNEEAIVHRIQRLEGSCGKIKRLQEIL